MLKLRFTNNKQNAVWLVEPKVTVGRSAACDLVLDDAAIKPNHAEIQVNHEKLQLQLLADVDNVSVNNKPVKLGSKAAVVPGDLIRFGQTELQVVDPKQTSRPAPTVTRQEESTGWALKANHTALSNRIFALKTANVVGRSNECDITLAAAHLSRRHAELRVKNGLLYVKDLGSSNGTYVNGERVKESRVKRGDDLRFDTLSFGVIGPSDDLDKTTVRTVPKGVASTPLARANSSPARANSSPARAKAAAGRTTNAKASKPQSPRRAASAESPRSSQVETIAPSQSSKGRGGLIGLGLLIIIAGGVFYALRNGWIQVPI